MKQLCIALALAMPLWAQDDVCFDCHEVSTESSIHEGFDCLDCHTRIDLDEHIDEGMLPTFFQEEACGTCHEDEWSEHATSVHGLKINGTSPDEATCVDCHGTHDVLPADDPNSMVHPAKMVTTCGRCHSNPELMERHNIAIPDPVTRYEQSIHFRVLEESGYTSATCNDCHGTHDIQNMRHARSAINYWNVATTCGKCHVAEYEEFQRSDHWLALQRGVHDAPACITCHGEHAITDPTGRYDIIKKREMADHTCLKCHSDEEMALKYGLSEGVAAAYRDSYHGLAVLRGDEDAAACYDCHGVHAILAAKYQSSTINPNNLQSTCATCHPNASPQFSRTYTHSSVLVLQTPVEHIVRNIYIALIIGVIGFMVVHNGIVFIGYVRRKNRELAAGIIEVPEVENLTTTIRRFSPNERLQHILILVSFFTLVITGFALKFSDAGWVKILSYIGLTETARGLIHRIAAVVMIVVAAWHLGYIVASKWGRQHLIGMLPTVQDIKDFMRSMRAYLSDKTPDIRPGIFDYTEKIEYWALVWGTVVMIITGFILWFPTALGEATPAWLIKVAEVIHYWEAWLATLAIIIWHLFFTIFHPEEYPGNTSIFTGKMNLEMWRHKHGGFYRELQEEMTRYRKGDLAYEELSPFAKRAIEDLPPSEESV
jgi:formate dehydrogenase gamma subunit